ncbi:hypothetical protein OS493_006360 [Desmophyllum pertusum]|uniref:Uncharacterized protein n=1 Tax=Desmophyllum pertusum TaxID=174260 RepID=A0A9X0DC58_9CNID|nr:hypothetical protein OS493_006360 [Desmophyllum pertusum]
MTAKAVLFLIGILMTSCKGLQHKVPEEENCRQVEIDPSIVDRTLVGHVFKSMEIQASSGCEVNCFIEADCVSFNNRPLQNGKHLCELSNSTHLVRPGDLKDREGTVYTTFKNPCSSNPCPVIKRCQTGFTSKGYRCICPNGMMGQNCTEGPPFVEVVPNKIETQERRDVVMICNATGNPMPDLITWMKSQGSLPNSRSIVSEGNLTLLNVTTDDSGSYVCTATSIMGTNSSSVQLRVHTALKFITRPPSSVLVYVGQALSLSCSASSDLKPNVSWTFDGTTTLPPGVAIDASNDLLVLSANFTHIGTYTCSATNRISALHANVIVYIKYPETCGKIKTNITDVSGDYIIDPDGVQGELPFTAYCNMTDKGGIGVTVVSHDSENRTHVNGFEAAGSYSRDIQYIGASHTQLKGLTDVSTNCQQFIKFECKGASLV